MKIANINNTFQSYQQLINLYQENKSKVFADVNIEIDQWFAANMSAALGALLDLLIENFNEVHFNYIQPKIEEILQKNSFLTFYGKKKQIDLNHTTIRFLKLNLNDGKYFNSYIFSELLSRSELPKMSELVKLKIAEAIYEIFVNAQIHSETKHIYTCGQFYPQKDTIEFTIVDTGIGFRNRVNKRFNSNLTAIQAIKWAIQDKHTTKTDISGGIGLALLKEFIEKNDGKMQIVSNDGFYEFGRNGEQINVFNEDFPGTIVNLQFKTNDNCSYYMKQEIDNNIF